MTIGSVAFYSLTSLSKMPHRISAIYTDEDFLVIHSVPYVSHILSPFFSLFEHRLVLFHRQRCLIPRDMSPHPA